MYALIVASALTSGGKRGWLRSHVLTSCPQNLPVCDRFRYHHYSSRDASGLKVFWRVKGVVGSICLSQTGKGKAGSYSTALYFSADRPDLRLVLFGHALMRRKSVPSCPKKRVLEVSRSGPGTSDTAGRPVACPQESRSLPRPLSYNPTS